MTPGAAALSMEGKLLGIAEITSGGEKVFGANSSSGGQFVLQRAAGPIT
jgi:hypothetical protein